MKGDEGFVDRAVVAPVEDENLRAAGDLACQADGKAVGVSGGEARTASRLSRNVAAIPRQRRRRLRTAT